MDGKRSFVIIIIVRIIESIIIDIWTFSRGTVQRDDMKNMEDYDRSRHRIKKRQRQSDQRRGEDSQKRMISRRSLLSRTECREG